jgi:hypothetical protein
MWRLLTVFPQNMATFATTFPKKPFVQFAHDFFLSPWCEPLPKEKTLHVFYKHTPCKGVQ